MSKGEKGGRCNRTSCTNNGAKYFNHSTRKYYCEQCAVDLNRYNKKEAFELYGHDLCTLDKIVPEEKQKLIDQAQQIADCGCSPVRNCQKECALYDKVCKAGGLFDYHDSKFVAQAFLAGIGLDNAD